MNSGLIVISPVWPGYDSGYAYAVLSSLRIYSKAFKTVVFISLSDDPGKELPKFNNVWWKSIPVKLGPKAIRFIWSLVNKYPATVQAFNSNKLRATVLNLITHHKRELFGDRDPVVLFEDLPATVLMNSIKNKFPEIKLYLRSHNVLGEAFEGFNSGNKLKNLPWKLEIQRLKSYERKILQMMDKCWAITTRDADILKQYYGVAVDGIIGINFLGSEFPELSMSGSSQPIVLHLGTVDVRKGHGLQLFIEQTWPLVRRDFPEARFFIGGRNTSKLSDDKNGIFGLGYIEDQTAFLNRGRIFVNTQLFGTGIKVKSLIAMLHGKVLVSTTKGVEGIDGVDGVHYLVATSFSHMNEILKNLFRNPELVDGISSNARDFVMKNYDFSNKSVQDFLDTY